MFGQVEKVQINTQGCYRDQALKLRWPNRTTLLGDILKAVRKHGEGVPLSVVYSTGKSQLCSAEKGLANLLRFQTCSFYLIKFIAVPRVCSGALRRLTNAVESFEFIMICSYLASGPDILVFTMQDLGIFRRLEPSNPTATIVLPNLKPSIRAQC